MPLLSPPHALELLPIRRQRLDCSRMFSYTEINRCFTWPSFVILTMSRRCRWNTTEKTRIELKANTLYREIEMFFRNFFLFLSETFGTTSYDELKSRIVWNGADTMAGRERTTAVTIPWTVYERRAHGQESGRHQTSSGNESFWKNIISVFGWILWPQPSRENYRSLKFAKDFPYARCIYMVYVYVFTCRALILCVFLRSTCHVVPRLLFRLHSVPKAQNAYVTSRGTNRLRISFTPLPPFQSSS